VTNTENEAARDPDEIARLRDSGVTECSAFVKPEEWRW
jgi:hypothetical protein